MVKLRLRRRGRKKHPFYDIVAIDGRARRDGASIERVGYIDPMTSPKTVVLSSERALYWLGVGAQPTDVVRQILSREGVLLRRHLALKGHSEAEIEAAVAQHRDKASARHTRLKQRRADRAKAKAAAAAAPVEAPAPAAEEPAAEAEAPAEAAE
ncbi:MAG: 30S ribosomal protein S16 ['Candidatus Kapabacteria' thiocyanatum]|uniref:Small ribosomal subunit protein bS16 n=1 Tax=Candidatus Kapaibacterium thiocyanatum TaxID=1895771 RepID=A0A1M3KWR6_9BACT|nr:30S ribosomal protein S16 ['Candidatus Kapabacteria' thiocyanatum]OJX56911.1 MAG: 30S ribosomal protein S16 ['Candidatus Kapabacteria' thiocyanatum]